MKRIFTINLFLMLLGTPGYAQQVDTLFSNSLFYNKLYDDGAVVNRAFIDSLIQTAETGTGDAKIKALHTLLNGYYFSNPELSRDLASQSLALARAQGSDSLVAFSLHYLGLAYIYLGQHRLSVDTYSKALRTPYANLHPDFKSWVSLNMANSNFSLGNYDEAAQLYYQAAALNDSIQNRAFSAKVYENLGTLFLETGNLDESLNHYKSALTRLDAEKDKRILADIYSNLAVLEIKRGNINIARNHVDVALKMAFALKDSSKITEIYLAHGNALFDHGDYQTAFYQFKIGLGYCDSRKYVILYDVFLHGLGKTCLYLGQVKKAEGYLSEALAGLEAQNATAELYDLELSLSRLYARTGDWVQFNRHLEKSEYYKTAALEAQELATIHELKLLYETEQKDHQLEAQQVRIVNQQRQIILVLLAAILFLGGFIITLVLRRRLKEANRILYQKNLDMTQRWKQLQHFYLTRDSHVDKIDETPLFIKIARMMTNEKLYTNPELTIDSVAKSVQSNTKYVSQAIHENAEMNFSSYINIFRIEEAKQLLNAHEGRHWSMDAIAEHCGFNNPTSFYQAFKKNTGMTPAAFKKSTISE